MPSWTESNDHTAVSSSLKDFAYYTLLRNNKKSQVSSLGLMYTSIYPSWDSIYLYKAWNSHDNVWGS